MKRNKAEYLVFHSVESMWKFMGKKWKEISLAAIRENGFFSVALSGGKTPIGLYQYLASLKGLPWIKTHIFLVDERFVPATDTDSNYRMIRETFLNRISPASENIHPVSTDEPSLQESARRYEEELRAFFELQPGGLPHFDMILLGLGEDGHTASLFPGTKALKERNHLAAPVMLETALHDRITLTLPVINNAGNVFFLVKGASKAEVLKKLIDEKDRTLPASMVRPEKGRLFFLMDKEAGSKLKEVQ